MPVPAPVSTQTTVSRPAPPAPVPTSNVRLARTPIRVGILAGATVASVRQVDGSELWTSPTKTGLQLGLLADIPLGNHWSIQPNLLYVAKGWGESAFGISKATTLNYLKLPVTVNYLIPTGVGIVRLGAGPYVGYGLSITTAAKNSADLKFGTGKDDANPLDYGGQVSTQFQLSSGFLVGATYSIGLANLNNSSSDGTMTNRAFGFSVGYVFGSKR